MQKSMTVAAALAVWLGVAGCSPEAASDTVPQAPPTEAASPPETAPGELEMGVDRPGADFRTLYDAADAEACRAACRDDTACRSFTWVEAGVQAETPVCWLKDQVPGAIPTEWAISGVMPNRPAAETH